MNENKRSVAQEVFFLAMWEWLRARHDLPFFTEDSDPVRAWEGLKTAHPTEAMKGLQEAVRDLVEMTKDLREQEIESLDLYLRKRDAPTLTSLRLQQKPEETCARAALS